MNQRIYLSPPHLNGLEIEYVQKAITSGWLAPFGEQIDLFENNLQNKLNTNKSLLVLNSGTSAIHLALKLIGVTNGDKIICQTNTYIATANPISYCGAEPIFIDSELDSWNMCPNLLEDAVIKTLKAGIKPKAIIGVHIYGMPFQADRILEIGKEYDIPIIEDAAEALGSSYKNNECGKIGDFGILSFNGNKIITTSSGGALITNTKSEKKHALHLATQAKTSSTGFSHDSIGYNYRMSNILASLGNSQLTDLDKRVSKRRKIFNNYKTELEQRTPLSFQPESTGHYSNRWLTSVLVRNEDERNQLIAYLEGDNIEARQNWTPLHTQRPYLNSPSFLNGNSLFLHQNGLCLPSGSNLSETDQDRVIDRVLQFFG